MSLATQVPPWAEIISATIVRAHENKLGVVSVHAESLRILWTQWNDERERAENHGRDLTRARTEVVELREEVAVLRKGVAAAIITLENTACSVR